MFLRAREKSSSLEMMHISSQDKKYKGSLLMTPQVIFHIAAGTVALLSGAVALGAKKGGKIHRQSGKIFFYSMILMAASGTYLAYLASVYITVLAGSLVLYLLTSGTMTVSRRQNQIGLTEKIIFACGLGVTAFGAYLCWLATRGITDSLGAYSVPAAIYFIFTTLAVLGVVTDARVLLKKGIMGKQRILRHIWRMCVPLYIAASSFFTGQQQVFPEALQGTFYLSIPEYSVLLLLFFWLGKTWMQKRPGKAKQA